MLIKIHEEHFGVSNVLDVTEENNEGVKERKATVQIIKPGRSLNNTIYSHSNMEEIAGLLNAGGSRKMYSNHVVTEGGVRLPRNMEDWVATIVEACIPDNNPANGVQASVKFRPTQKATELHETAKQVPAEVGASIDGRALARKVDRWDDGKPGILIEKIVGMNSTDFVTEASAGGGIVALESLKSAQRDDLLGIVGSLLLSTPEGSPLMESLSQVSEIIGSEDPEKLIRGLSEADDNDGKPEFIVKFSKRVTASQKRSEFFRVLWAYESYVGDLAQDRETALEDRIKAAQDGAAYVLREAENVPWEDLEESVREFLQRPNLINPLYALAELVEASYASLTGSDKA